HVWRSPLRQRARLTTFFALILSLLTACSSTVSVTAAGPTTTPTLTSTPQPTCAGLSGFSNAGHASARSSFTDASFPERSISTTPKQTTSGTGLFTIIELDACTNNSSTSTIHAFYAEQLVNGGWTESTTYPYDGQYQAACGDPYCWLKDSAPRYVSLETVADKGSGLITFHLRLAKPPATPKCPASTYGKPPTTPYATFVPDSDIPLPPLTLFGPSTGSGALSSDSMCSAGTAASIDKFY